MPSCQLELTISHQAAAVAQCLNGGDWTLDRWLDTRIQDTEIQDTGGSIGTQWSLGWRESGRGAEECVEMRPADGVTVSLCH